MILFSLDGVFVDDDFDEDEEFRKLSPIFNLRKYYDQEVVFDDDLTLEDLFDLLYPNIRTLEQDFEAWTNDTPLEPFFKEIQKQPTEDDIENIDFFEIRKEFHIHKHIDKYDKTNHSFSHELTCFHGISFEDYDENDVINVYEVDILPLNNYKHVPIIISDVCIFTRITDNGPVEEPTIDRETNESTINLHEMLKAVLSEITMYGSPKERNRMIEEFKAFEAAREESGEEFNKEEWTIKQLEQRLEEEESEENFDVCKEINTDLKILKERLKKSQKKK